MTITLQIGNSDDKLSQREWSDFVHMVELVLENEGAVVHFSGCSHGAMKWQNACWVFETSEPERIATQVAAWGRSFKQDSVAWTVGTTEFI